jgi:SAM-dependent methyltransferase
MPASPNPFSKSDFDTSYEKLILSGNFHEVDDYYRIHKPRYQRTLEIILSEVTAKPASCLEIGGGQISLLLKDLFKSRVAIADVNSSYYPFLKDSDIPFFEFDLLHDEKLNADEKFDLIVICEVIEHIPIPAHLVFKKMLNSLNPGGFIFLTTPNLYRFRNCIRMFTGGDIFCHFRYPEKGSGMGHFTEYSSSHIHWQLEEAGLKNVQTKITQLMWKGSSPFATYSRYALRPLLSLRPIWKDSLIAWGQKPN